MILIIEEVDLVYLVLYVGISIKFKDKSYKKRKEIKVNRRLHIGNLAYSVTNEELEKLFSSEGSVTSAKVIRSLDGRSKGFGFVEMETEEEASKAMEKYDQSSFKERTIWVNEARPQTNRGFGESRRGYNYNRKPQNDLNSKLRRLRKRY